MTPFWRTTQLTDQEQELLTAVFRAHEVSVFRNNISSQTAVNAFAGSGDYIKAIAAAMMTLGVVHAPIAETIDVLETIGRLEEIVGATDSADGIVDRHLRNGMLVPGWGNSFIKGRKDDLWLGVDAILAKHFPKIYGRIEAATQVLHRAGKMVFPNPSAYTAATAIALQVPSPIAPYLFLAPRLNGWSKLIQDTFLTPKQQAPQCNPLSS
jgi:citrate synthase